MQPGWCRREPTRNRCRARCATHAFRQRWMSTRKSYRRHSAARYSSYPSLQKTERSNHGPVRSNKARFSVSQTGWLGRQVIERYGGASLDRTDDLIVANDALFRSHLIDSTQHASISIPEERNLL